MTPPANKNPGSATPALMAAQRHLARSQAALTAALLGKVPGPGHDTAAHAPRSPRAPGNLTMLAHLADRSLSPWAERRPWALVGLAAATGALLATRRGRGLVGAALMTALVSPPPGRVGMSGIGRALGLVLRRPPEPPA